MGADGVSLLRGNGFQHTSFESHPYGRALQRLGEVQRRTLSLQQRCERGTALVRSTIPRIASSSRFPQVSPLRYSASVLTPGNRRGLVRCLMHRLVLLAGHLQWLAIHVGSSCPKRRLLGGRIKVQTSKKRTPLDSQLSRPHVRSSTRVISVIKHDLLASTFTLRTGHSEARVRV